MIEKLRHDLNSALNNAWRCDSGADPYKLLSFIEQKYRKSDELFAVLTAPDILKRIAQESASVAVVYMHKIMDLYALKRKEEVVQSFVDPEFLVTLAQKNAVEAAKMFVGLVQKAPDYKNDIRNAFSHLEFLQAMDQAASDVESYEIHAMLHEILSGADPEDYEDVFMVMTQLYPSYVLEKPFVKTLAKISLDQSIKMGLQEVPNGGYVCRAFAVASIPSSGDYMLIVNANKGEKNIPNIIVTSGEAPDTITKNIAAPLQTEFRQRRLLVA